MHSKIENYLPGSLFATKEKIHTVPARARMLILDSKELRTGLDQRNDVRLKVYVQLENGNWKFTTWSTTYWNLEQTFEKVL